ncbi:hypothetical protein [Pelagicoccus sp. SDUM812005]|uniref:hypothetical protein n=1 Tax=Pelagicoccus sp. SDUM812005 TaxID=3041257 RepID=UPI00280E3211|nr:hypothetical protein [Pelagicoccus sp. SDUM812005]MDQ8181075.1 hypothetical protein [Pelagicoccus sp. SDUM812005]
MTKPYEVDEDRTGLFAWSVGASFALIAVAVVVSWILVSFHDLEPEALDESEAPVWASEGRRTATSAVADGDERALEAAMEEIAAEAENARKGERK